MKGEIQMIKNVKQMEALTQIKLVIAYWYVLGEIWTDIAIAVISTVAGYAADLQLIDIVPVIEFIAAHGTTTYDKLDPDANEIPYMQQQIKLIRNMDAQMQRLCDEAAKRLVAGDATVRDICQLITDAWHICNQSGSHTYAKPIYSLCLALIRTAKCWPQPPGKNEKEQIVRILKTVITDAENKISGRYADDIIF